MAGETSGWAHCRHGVPGGVPAPASNTSRDQAVSLPMPASASLCLLTSPQLESSRADLDSAALKLLANGELPSLPPASISFLGSPKAGNSPCRAEP